MICLTYEQKGVICVIPFQVLCLYICWSGFKGSCLRFLAMWDTTNIDEAQRSQSLQRLIIEPQSVCVCAWVVLVVLLRVKRTFLRLHEDSSSSVHPALFSELGFRVYHRWGVGRWNGKTKMRKVQIYLHACLCRLIKYVFKLKAILCYFVSQVLWISTTSLGDTG